MIRFHPDRKTLVSFSKGNLTAAESIMVSAHCDLCPACRRTVAEETARLAEEIFEFADDDVFETGHIGYQYDSMLASITQLPKAAAPVKLSPDYAQYIELDGQRFAVPKTLQRYVKSMGNWSSLVGKLWQAPVSIGGSNVAHFIYMGKGGGVPEHTHRGQEYNLVLDGEFNDGINHYHRGDFIVMGEKDTHAPRSDARNGCLVFSVLDQPLHFTSGIARLLNPFSHLFFK